MDRSRWTRSSGSERLSHRCEDQERDQHRGDDAIRRQRIELERGDQRHQEVIESHAAQKHDEPALRKTRYIEGADKHHARQHENEKYREQPIYIDGGKAKKSCHAESNSPMRS